MKNNIRQDWLSNVRGDRLAGLVVAFILRLGALMRFVSRSVITRFVNALTIIFPYAMTLAVAGLLEPMMTAAIVDDLTGTPNVRRSRTTAAPSGWTHRTRSCTS